MDFWQYERGWVLKTTDDGAVADVWVNGRIDLQGNPVVYQGAGLMIGQSVETGEQAYVIHLHNNTSMPVVLGEASPELSASVIPSVSITDSWPYLAGSRRWGYCTDVAAGGIPTLSLSTSSFGLSSSLSFIRGNIPLLSFLVPGGSNDWHTYGTVTSVDTVVATLSHSANPWIPSTGTTTMLNVAMDSVNLYGVLQNITSGVATYFTLIQPVAGGSISHGTLPSGNTPIGGINFSTGLSVILQPDGSTKRYGLPVISPLTFNLLRSDASVSSSTVIAYDYGISTGYNQSTAQGTSIFGFVNSGNYGDNSHIISGDHGWIGSYKLDQGVNFLLPGLQPNDPRGAITDDTTGFQLLTTTQVCNQTSRRSQMVCLDPSTGLVKWTIGPNEADSGFEEIFYPQCAVNGVFVVYVDHKDCSGVQWQGPCVTKFLRYAQYGMQGGPPWVNPSTGEQLQNGENPGAIFFNTITGPDAATIASLHDSAMSGMAGYTKTYTIPSGNRESIRLYDAKTGAVINDTVPVLPGPVSITAAFKTDASPLLDQWVPAYRTVTGTASATVTEPDSSPPYQSAIDMNNFVGSNVGAGEFVQAFYFVAKEHSDFTGGGSEDQDPIDHHFSINPLGTYPDGNTQFRSITVGTSTVTVYMGLVIGQSPYYQFNYFPSPTALWARVFVATKGDVAAGYPSMLVQMPANYAVQAEFQWAGQLNGYNGANLSTGITFTTKQGPVDPVAGSLQDPTINTWTLPDMGSGQTTTITAPDGGSISAEFQSWNFGNPVGRADGRLYVVLVATNDSGATFSGYLYQIDLRNPSAISIESVTTMWTGGSQSDPLDLVEINGILWGTDNTGTLWKVT